MMRNATHNRRRLKVSLSLVAVLLIASAVLRLSGTAGQAVAQSLEKSQLQEKTINRESIEIIDEEGVREMLVSLRQREADLVEKENQMRTRMQALKTVNTEVTRKITQLEQAEERLRATLAIAESAAEDDIDKLTQVYESMKPKQAAALFEEMDPNFAAGFLGRMRPDAAAAIMAGLSSEAANLYSVILAGRNANAPRD